jgi:protocatechuate 3,4-dioxygenase beta subunit
MRDDDGHRRDRPLARPDEPIFDQGLAFDLETLLDRRGVLKLAGIGGLGLALAACSATTSTSAATSAASTGATSSTTEDACTTIPEETAGPYPGDGSNGPDVLNQSGIVRSDIRSSFGDLSGTAEGIPLSIELSLEDASSCAPLAGAAVYVWHCDRDGRYSLYTVADQNYLRGVQEADDAGTVRFASIFPACYPGRWPHVHFEVYQDLGSVTDAADPIATSQIALPKDTCDVVYATSGYEQSVTNLSQISLSSDLVFGDDGGVHQLGAMTGSVADGYAVALTTPVTTS